MCTVSASSDLSADAPVMGVEHPVLYDYVACDSVKVRAHDVKVVLPDGVGLTSGEKDALVEALSTRATVDKVLLYKYGGGFKVMAYIDKTSIYLFILRP